MKLRILFILLIITNCIDWGMTWLAVESYKIAWETNLLVAWAIDKGFIPYTLLKLIIPTCLLGYLIYHVDQIINVRRWLICLTVICCVYIVLASYSLIVFPWHILN